MNGSVALAAVIAARSSSCSGRNSDSRSDNSGTVVVGWLLLLVGVVGDVHLLFLH